MKKWEIEKTKTTFIISTFKTDIMKMGLVFSISNFFIAKRLWQIIGGVLAAVIWLYRQQFFSAIRWQIWPIFDPSPLKYADVLNGWSLVLYNVGSSTAAALTAR